MQLEISVNFFDIYVDNNGKRFMSNMKTRVIFRNIQITNLISNRNKFYFKFNQIS